MSAQINLPMLAGSASTSKSSDTSTKNDESTTERVNQATAEYVIIFFHRFFFTYIFLN